jgi:hypothetical protein
MKWEYWDIIKIYLGIYLSSKKFLLKNVCNDRAFMYGNVDKVRRSSYYMFLLWKLKKNNFCLK